MIRHGSRSSINPLTDDKILDLTKLKAFANDKLNQVKMMISLYDRKENTVGKGENAGCQPVVMATGFFYGSIIM